MNGEKRERRDENKGQGQGEGKPQRFVSRGNFLGGASLLSGHSRPFASPFNQRRYCRRSNGAFQRRFFCCVFIFFLFFYRVLPSFTGFYLFLLGFT